MALPSQSEEQIQDREFLRDVLEGLGRRQKALPCKYLYDETGSRLFERICELDDYYLTRAEADIFSKYLTDMARRIGPAALIVEPGAGNCKKVQQLLRQLDSPTGYYPIDISPEILMAAQGRMAAQLPGLTIRAAVGDFSDPEAWTGLMDFPACKKVVFFPGSTIGNFSPQHAEDLLAFFKSMLQPGDGLLIGTDLVKDAVVLERAYADSEHVTAAFNKNILVRINNELNADFDLALFAHRAFYHPLRQRVEMHLVSLKTHSVHIAGTRVYFEEGETIHTENSHKYSVAGFNCLLGKTGFTPVCHWSDIQRRYAVHYAQVN
ncbi:L-histidine N(alpha)-methyltransferase [Microbulbifer thermotolerans]|uniref:Dimethylhistidine N-methyltransferase n=1 Tax=Microbulbifer thermotolerans TaxID=252514 RepID=A0A143HLH7_MICTH|nr:L-histidine N(alpha)-methyltransferase [Microbulbifer thermotolerans]AMX02548.1 dimethylhistidine N-methyltransferase [Microbulbifer thermotolerans]MCX2782387.1 L-histidine N(alpha)-methyltransferase [Microbulbifer thermotolerans]MCX2794972.1 L-histidine N(alpha)-methyltransferase [Microbulbifer thermotolerans]MCX2800540.1 L-histidine N(alpha)-methyltransferase [Microbulbifer thermotolerans]MCX2831164.1 L-histidine N(alpha)-methyltransferase [Microbulbifer thermotolerans]